MGCLGCFILFSFNISRYCALLLSHEPTGRHPYVGHSTTLAFFWKTWGAIAAILACVCLITLANTAAYCSTHLSPLQHCSRSYSSTISVCMMEYWYGSIHKKNEGFMLLLGCQYGDPERSSDVANPRIRVSCSKPAWRVLQSALHLYPSINHWSIGWPTTHQTCETWMPKFKQTCHNPQIMRTSFGTKFRL